jgi:hypothetical protein
MAHGASGARVCTLRATVPGVGTIRHVLKLSRDHRALDREVRHGRLASQVVPERLLVRLQPLERVGPVNGWSAVASRLGGAATDLRSWIRMSPSRAEVRSLLEALFLDGLASVYADGRHDGSADAMDPVRFPLYRQVLVQEALDRLAPAFVRSRIATDGEATELRIALDSFAVEARIGGRDAARIPPGLRTAPAHGDLHGGNVLVYTGRNPAPALIDTSEFATDHHWAVDPARLHVDLVLDGVGHGAESMFWDELPEWRSRAVAVSATSCAPEDIDAPEPGVFGAAWIASTLDQHAAAGLDEAEREWQWHTALAAQYLRGVYQPRLPAPKQVLAAVAAHDQLRLAHDALG